MHPSSGQGCVNAMQDAIVLGNVLYDISDGTKPVTADMITEAFKEYRKQRFPYAKQHVLEANIFAKIVVGKVNEEWEGRIDAVLRQAGTFRSREI
jgi:2-polyprenyl-6-methoxyphenol hydroxylase-like FAD-dependent oxidoreductase